MVNLSVVNAFSYYPFLEASLAEHLIQIGIDESIQVWYSLFSYSYYTFIPKYGVYTIPAQFVTASSVVN